jgi:hypothetical protein
MHQGNECPGGCRYIGQTPVKHFPLTKGTLLRSLGAEAIFPKSRFQPLAYDRCARLVVVDAFGAAYTYPSSSPRTIRMVSDAAIAITSAFRVRTPPSSRWRNVRDGVSETPCRRMKISEIRNRRPETGAWLARRIGRKWRISGLRGQRPSGKPRKYAAFSRRPEIPGLAGVRG